VVEDEGEDDEEVVRDEVEDGGDVEDEEEVEVDVRPCSSRRILPPGLTIRTSSASVDAGSVKEHRPNVSMAVSNDEDSKLVFVASSTLNVVGGREEEEDDDDDVVDERESFLYF
jgi:hypothetical protein